MHDLSKEAQIHEVFPKVICRHDNIGLDLIPGMLEMLDDIKGQTSGNGALNVNSSHTTIQTLHRLPVFKDLSKEILRVARGFMVEYGYANRRAGDLFMGGMWFNHSDKGNFLFPHTHSGSFLSCAYYLKANPEKHTIIFHDFTKNIVEEPQGFKNMSSPSFGLPCTPGRLLIFHSDLPHGVPLQEHEEERVVISCNMLLKTTPLDSR
tara:strand:+ start:323 stop:943 length:621 start_codon:yes stop_codon:yes gene_type:complete